MKSFLLTTVTALLAGALAFGLMRSHKMSARTDVLLDSIPELLWIKADLNLSDTQFKAVLELHGAYRPVCIELCHRIEAAQKRVESISRASRSMTPELQQALHEHATTHAECQQAMLGHIYRTAGLLDQEQAAKYIRSVVPVALEITHSRFPHRE